MALSVANEVVWSDIDNAPFVNIARRDMPSSYEVAEPLRCERINLVVVRPVHSLPPIEWFSRPWGFHAPEGLVVRHVQIDRQGGAFAVAQHPAVTRRDEEPSTTRMGGGTAEPRVMLNAVPSRASGGRTPQARIGIGKMGRALKPGPSYGIEQPSIEIQARNTEGTIPTALRIISSKDGHTALPHGFPRPAVCPSLVLIWDRDHSSVSP